MNPQRRQEESSVSYRITTGKKEHGIVGSVEKKLRSYVSKRPEFTGRVTYTHLSNDSLLVRLHGGSERDKERFLIELNKFTKNMDPEYKVKVSVEKQEGGLQGLADYGNGSKVYLNRIQELERSVGQLQLEKESLAQERQRADKNYAEVLARILKKDEEITVLNAIIGEELSTTEGPVYKSPSFIYTKAIEMFGRQALERLTKRLEDVMSSQQDVRFSSLKEVFDAVSIPFEYTQEYESLLEEKQEAQKEIEFAQMQKQRFRYLNIDTSKAEELLRRFEEKRQEYQRKVQTAHSIKQKVGDLKDFETRALLSSEEQDGQFRISIALPIAYRQNLDELKDLESQIVK